ncbi:MAG: hypothetical protein GX654_03860 [Desulfatiglans sp.]|nr:hypothetical protein [Desulfatiglans sp.]
MNKVGQGEKNRAATKRFISTAPAVPIIREIPFLLSPSSIFRTSMPDVWPRLPVVLP